MLVRIVELDDEERSQNRCVVCDAPAEYQEHHCLSAGSNFFHFMCRTHVIKKASVHPEDQWQILPASLA